MAVHDTMVTTESQGNTASGRAYIFHALFFWRVHIFHALSFLLTCSNISCSVACLHILCLVLLACSHISYFVVSSDVFKYYRLCRFF